MAQSKGRLTEEIPKHRVLREVYRHYLEFRQYVSDTGNHVIEHGYWVHDPVDTEKRHKVAITISFWDLFQGLQYLSPRKRQAVWYNVILDQKQRDVAKLMKITTVSVGQYVEQAMLQLSEEYFADDKYAQEIENDYLQQKCDSDQEKKTPPLTKKAKSTRPMS